MGYWAFHGPKHAGKELADVLVWWDEVVLLLEAKTKGTPDSPKESWIREKLRDAIESINDRADMLRRGDVEVLRNRWRGEVKWDSSGVKDYIGIVVLHHNFDRDNPNRYDPLEIAPEAFKASKVPVAVMSLYDFMELVRYESTAWDLITYLEARFQLSRRQRLLVQDEFEIYQTLWSHWPELTAGHGSEEQAKKIQEYQVSISNAIMRSKIATEQGYADLAASILIDFCMRVMTVEADRDKSGKPISDFKHDFMIKSIGAISEMTRLRRSEYGKRLLDAAHKALGSSKAIEKMSYSPSRDRAYLFVAFGEQWSAPTESYLVRRAQEHMNERKARSCFCLGGRASEIIATHGNFLAAIKGEGSRELTEEETLGATCVFVEKNQ